MSNVTVYCEVTGTLGNFTFKYTGDPSAVVSQNGDIDLRNTSGTVHLTFELLDKLSEGSIDFDDSHPGTTDNFWVCTAPEKPDPNHHSHEEFSDHHTAGKKKTKIKHGKKSSSGNFCYSLRFLGSDGVRYDSDPMIVNR